MGFLKDFFKGVLEGLCEDSIRVYGRLAGFRPAAGRVTLCCKGSGEEGILEIVGV